MTRNEEKDNPFLKIHILLKEKENILLLKTMLDEDEKRLKKDFETDKNHAWYCIGCAFFDLGEFEKAKKSFLRAHSYEKNDHQSLIACANCFSEMQKPKCAEVTLEKALDLNPKGKDRAAIIYNLGNALFDQGLYIDAIKKYNLLLKRRDHIGMAARKNNIHSHQLSREINSF